jgi:hypothetical protein
MSGRRRDSSVKKILSNQSLEKQEYDGKCQLFNELFHGETSDMFINRNQSKSAEQQHNELVETYIQH